MSIYMRSMTPKGSNPYAYNPSIPIELSNFPELDKEVGEEVLFVVKAVIRSKSLNDNGRDKCINVEIKEIGINREQSVEKQRDMWAARTSSRSVKSKADFFSENITSASSRSSLSTGMPMLNDADVQLNKMLSR